MPEDTESTPETIAFSEYQKLQRTLDRRSRAAKQAEQRIESLESGIQRLERLLEGTVKSIAPNDPERKRVVDQLLTQNAAQRTQDMTAAQLTADLNQIIEEADMEWDDERFDHARDLLDEINESGDLKRSAEVRRAIQEAVSGGQSRTLKDEVKEALAELFGDQLPVTSTPRVDTGSSSVRTSPVSRSTLSEYTPHDRQGFKEKLDAALDQLSG